MSHTAQASVSGQTARVQAPPKRTFRDVTKLPGIILAFNGILCVVDAVHRLKSGILDRRRGFGKAMLSKEARESPQRSLDSPNLGKTVSHAVVAVKQDGAMRFIDKIKSKAGQRVLTRHIAADTL